MPDSAVSPIGSSRPPRAARALRALGRKAVRARQMDREDRALIARAWLVLQSTRLGYRIAPGSVARSRRATWFSETTLAPSGHPGGPGADNRRTARSERIAAAVDVAARNSLPRVTCLPRAVVLCRMLRREGIPAVVRIGVRRVGGELAAHAWVESGGGVVGDRPDVAESFAPLSPHVPLPAGALLAGFPGAPLPAPAPEGGYARHHGGAKNDKGG